eukprot:462494_1
MGSCKITFSRLILSSLLILHILPGTFASLVYQASASKETDNGTVSVKIVGNLVTVSTPKDWDAFQLYYYVNKNCIGSSSTLSAMCGKPFRVSDRFDKIAVYRISLPDLDKIGDPVVLSFPKDDAKENKKSIQRFSGLDDKLQRALEMSESMKQWSFCGLINNVRCLEVWAEQVGNIVKIWSLKTTSDFENSDGTFEKDVLRALIEQAQNDPTVSKIAYGVGDWITKEWDIALAALGFPTDTVKNRELDEYDRDASYRVLQTMSLSLMP